MLQISFLKENKERVLEGLKTRNFKDEDLKVVDEVLELDDLRKKTQTELDTTLAERNKLSKEVGGLFHPHF